MLGIGIMATHALADGAVTCGEAALSDTAFEPGSLDGQATPDTIEAASAFA